MSYSPPIAWYIMHKRRLRTAVALAPPVNTVAPALSTTSPAVSSSISVTTGAWTGSPTPSFSYQWFWADAGLPIAGATSSSYTPVLGDIGHTLLCHVTGDNTAGTITASSNTSGGVTGSSAGLRFDDPANSGYVGTLV